MGLDQRHMELDQQTKALIGESNRDRGCHALPMVPEQSAEHCI
jgi:hypothetical protein